MQPYHLYFLNNNLNKKHKHFIKIGRNYNILIFSLFLEFMNYSDLVVKFAHKVNLNL